MKKLTNIFLAIFLATSLSVASIEESNANPALASLAVLIVSKPILISVAAVLNTSTTTVVIGSAVSAVAVAIPDVFLIANWLKTNTHFFGLKGHSISSVRYIGR